MKRALFFILLSCSSFVFGTKAFPKPEDYQDGNMKPPLQYSLPSRVYPRKDGALPFFVEGAYTYYVPYQEGMNIAYDDGTQNIRGNVKRPKTPARSGFTVGLGVNTFHDGWLAFINYLWFYNDSPVQTNALVAGLNEYNTPFGSLTLTFDGLSSKFTNFFNRLDGVISRGYFVGEYLTTTTGLGVLAAWENQYLEIHGDISTVFEGDIQQILLKQEWWGIGPYYSNKLTFYSPSGYGAFLKLGTSLLLTNHNPVILSRRVTEELQFVELDQNKSVIQVFLEPMIETSLGLCKNFSYERCAFYFELSWDLQTYFSHNGYVGFYSPTGIMGNYSMQGLKLSSRINF